MKKFISFGYQLVGTMPEVPYNGLNVHFYRKNIPRNIEWNQ